MDNHGNYVASLSQLGRWLAEQAEEGGATILPETTGHELLADHGHVVGVRTGDKGRGRDGEELANFEPGSDVLARVPDEFAVMTGPGGLDVRVNV